MKFDAEDKGDFEEYALQLPDANVVDRAGAEFAEKFFCPEASEVLDDEGPEVKDVVS